MTTAIRVNLGKRSYSITIGSNVIGNIVGWLSECCVKSRHAVLVSDENVLDSIALPIVAELHRNGYRTTTITVSSGEKSKSVAEASRIWQLMLEDRTDRGSIVMAVGGGVVGDLAGFVAATFVRGLPLVQIPTTLLSQVDSSVGGKTGVNLPNAKNIVGCFWQPSLVVIDINSLRTLPRREYVSGLAEVVKYGVIMLPELFDYLEEHADAVLSQSAHEIGEIIAQSCRAKASVVEQDERETTGLRAILNYGHTFAHALEAARGYGQLLHGEAVSIGMHMAAKLALQLGRVDQVFVDRQQRLLEKFELPTKCADFDAEQLWKLMQNDKKVEHGKLRFILPTRLGHVELVEGVTKDQVVDALN